MKFFESSSNNSQITTTSLSLYENNDLTLDTICCSTFDTNNINILTTIYQDELGRGLLLTPNPIDVNKEEEKKIIPDDISSK